MENLSKDKLMELIDDLKKERFELEKQKSENEQDAFDKGLEFFKQIWQMALDYKSYFEKIGETFYIQYKHTQISTTNLSPSINLRIVSDDYIRNFDYSVAFNKNIEEHMKEGYKWFKPSVLRALKELQENPIEYYQEKINKQLADAIQKYNDKNNKLKEELGE